MDLQKSILEKAMRYSKELFPGAKYDKDGDIEFEYGSTKAWIDVIPTSTNKGKNAEEFALKHDLPKFLVRVRALVLAGVPRSPVLFQWVATESPNNLGGIRVRLDDNGTCDLYYHYVLVGDTLDPGELKNALVVVAAIAANLDDEAQKKFGGKRWADIKQSS